MSARRDESVTVGLDIGGTKIAGTLSNAAGTVIASRWARHAARGLNDVATALAEVAHELEAETSAAVVDVGVGVSGLVSVDGAVTRAATLQLTDAGLAAAIGHRLGRPVEVDNDAQAALRAAVHHDRRSVRDAVLLAIGTGVGGAIVTDGRIVRGRLGLAGELGHFPVRHQFQERCVCGSSGCLEQFASGRGLAERARAAAVAGTADDLLTHAGVPARCLTAEHVVAAAHAGCIPALRLIEQAADCLGYALIGIAVTVEPAVIYLSGSLGHAAADLLIPRIAARMDEQWPFGAEVPRPTILLDQAGPLAGALGAGLLARDIRAHARNPTREATPVAEPS